MCELSNRLLRHFMSGRLSQVATLSMTTPLHLNPPAPLIRFGGILEPGEVVWDLDARSCHSDRACFTATPFLFITSTAVPRLLDELAWALLNVATTEKNAVAPKAYAH